MSYVCVCSCAREVLFKTCWLYCHRTLWLTSPMRVVEFGSFLHSYASSFSPRRFLGFRSELYHGNALNCYPPACFPSRPSLHARLLQHLTMSLNPTIEKIQHPSSHVSPLILLHPVSAGPRRIVPFTSSKWKCIHYEPNALGSQIPVRFKPSAPIYYLGSFGRS